jgi:hypothetical protein
MQKKCVASFWNQQLGFNSLRRVFTLVTLLLCGTAVHMIRSILNKSKYRN